MARLARSDWRFMEGVVWGFSGDKNKELEDIASNPLKELERAMRFELTTLTLASPSRLCPVQESTEGWPIAAR